MVRNLICAFLMCVVLSSCQLFEKIDTAGLQEKVIAAAKEAVIKVAYSKIDKNEALSAETKEFLKEVAKSFIDRTFERLKSEYEKLKQEEIEADVNQLVDDHINAVCGSYQKLEAKRKK